MRRNLILTIIYTIFNATLAFAEYRTTYPYIENAYPNSDIAISNITEVYVGDEFTFVTLEYITSRYLESGWISISSKTTLTSKNSNLSLPIIAWSLAEEDADILDFDQQYSVNSDRKYTFLLVFNAIPAGIENITIHENVGVNSFYWIGIHINNPKQSSTAPSAKGNSSSSSTPSKNTPAYEYDEPFHMSSSGTGFAIANNGIIATCFHVVEGARKVRVRGVNGDFNKTYKARVIGVDRNNDLAILEIEDQEFSNIGILPYKLSSKTTDVGVEVYVLGYPLRAAMGDEIKLTNGVISSRSGFQGDITSYQFSATVQPGNSGGPLFDSKGNIIGVVNARLQVESASYAVKTPYLKTLIESLDTLIKIPEVNILEGQVLSEQVKIIKQFIYIIEVE